MSDRRLSAAVFLILLLGAPTSARQEPTTPPPSGLIVGQTLDGATGKPVAGAIVSLALVPAPAGAAAPAPQPGPTGPMRELSDSSGHFVFHGLPAASYTLTASKPGYLDAAFGRRVPAGGSQPIVLQADERRGACDLRLWRHGSITGIVTDEAGEPLVGVQIRAVKRGVLAGVPKLMLMPGNISSTTDDRGRYRVASLAPGEYMLSVISTQATVPTPVVEAASAAMRNAGSADFDREIARSSPMASLGLNLGMTAGQRVGDLLLTTPLGFGGGSSSQLPMPVGTGAVFVYPTTFYPSTTSMSKAQVIAVGAGEDKTGIDFQLSPVQSVRVSGTLMGPGGPESMTTISLIPASAGELQREYDIATATTVTDGRGAFTFLGVPTDTYTLRVLKIPPRPVTPVSQSTTVIQTGTSMISSGGGQVDQPPIPQAPTLWAQQPLAVGERDVTDLVITLRNGARVSGRLEFAGSTPPPAPDRLRQATVQIDPADGRETSLNQSVTLSRGVVDADGQFKSYEQPPGRYTIRAASVPGWTFVGASWNGKEVGDTGFDIGGEDVTGVVLRFTDQPSDLSGRSADTHGPDAGATVLAFPASSSSWVNTGRSPLRLRSTRVGTSGTYRITGLPPGDYLVIALKDERADWQDAKYLERLAPLATRVTIGNGDHKVQDLQTREVK